MSPSSISYAFPPAFWQLDAKFALVHPSELVVIGCAEVGRAVPSSAAKSSTPTNTPSRPTRATDIVLVVIAVSCLVVRDRAVPRPDRATIGEGRERAIGMRTYSPLAMRTADRTAPSALLPMPRMRPSAAFRPRL